VVLHVGRLEDGRFALCDEQGMRVMYCRARGFQAAAGKWSDKHERPERMVSYRGRMRISEWAATVTSLKFDSAKEDDSAGNHDGA
jgi:hypothetical protein